MEREQRLKIGEGESVIGFAVDGFLEACVKPGALTAGFKGEGSGYGLESGLYFICWRLNSFPPPPTPFWTSVASFHSAVCGFQRWFTAGVVAAERSGKACNQIFCARTHQHSQPESEMCFNHRGAATMLICARKKMWWWCDKDVNNASGGLIVFVRSCVFQRRMWKALGFIDRERPN